MPPLLHLISKIAASEYAIAPLLPISERLPKGIRLNESSSGLCLVARQQVFDHCSISLACLS